MAATGVRADIQDQSEHVQIMMLKATINKLFNVMERLCRVSGNTASCTQKVLWKAIFATICPGRHATVSAFPVERGSFKAHHFKQ